MKDIDIFIFGDSITYGAYDNELSDGLHPNSIGHQKICDEVIKYLKNKKYN